MYVLEGQFWVWDTMRSFQYLKQFFNHRRIAEHLKDSFTTTEVLKHFDKGNNFDILWGGKVLNKQLCPHYIRVTPSPFYIVRQYNFFSPNYVIGDSPCQKNIPTCSICLHSVMFYKLTLGSNIALSLGSESFS